MINKPVSMKNIVYDAIENMGLDHNKWTPLFTRWAIEADQKIDAPKDYKLDIKVLTVNGCSAVLPCCVHSVKALVLGDYGCECGHIFSNIYSSYRRYSGIRFTAESTVGFIVVDVGSGRTSACNVRWNIQNGCIVLDGNYDTQKITIDTLCYVTDASGIPLTHATSADALTAYIEWRLAKRTRWNKNLGNIAEMGIRELFRDWTRLCAQARADSDVVSESEWDDMVRMWNDPMSGGNMIQFAYLS